MLVLPLPKANNFVRGTVFNHQPEFLIHILPRGKKPRRETDGAIGFDVSARAIVCSFKMDSKRPTLRKTLFDFGRIPADPDVAKYVVLQKRDRVNRDRWRVVAMRDVARRLREEPENYRLAYRLEPGERVLVAIGFLTAMPFPWGFWVAPRSGFASKFGITVANAPGTIDPDYRGEAGVAMLNNSKRAFHIFFDMRVAQILFGQFAIPTFREVAEGDLPKTMRGAGGFGSTKDGG